MVKKVNSASKIGQKCDDKKLAEHYKTEKGVVRSNQRSPAFKVGASHWMFNVGLVHRRKGPPVFDWCRHGAHSDLESIKQPGNLETAFIAARRKFLLFSLSLFGLWLFPACEWPCSKTFLIISGNKSICALRALIKLLFNYNN